MSVAEPQHIVDRVKEALREKEAIEAAPNKSGTENLDSKPTENPESDEVLKESKRSKG